MSNSKVINVIGDTVKLVLIFAVCLLIALVGGYLLAVWVGLVQKGTEYYRPLTVDTILNDLPFIGTNMIYIIAFLLVMGVIFMATWGYDRYTEGRGRSEEKPPTNPLQPPEVKQ